MVTCMVHCIHTTGVYNGYAADPDRDFSGFDLSQPVCTTVGCCKAACDGDSRCAVFMYAPKGYYGNSAPYCWLKTKTMGISVAVTPGRLISWTKTGEGW